MDKIILFFLLICSIGYPVICKGTEIKFQNGGSKYSFKDGDTCHTEDGKEGICMKIHKCTEINGLIKSRGGLHTKGTADIVNKRICGFALKESRVCCLPETIPSNPILPTINECGLANSVRIINGEDFPHGAHPWLVGIGYLQARGRYIKVECGGTLITKRHVLTAAHCFDSHPEFTHVILGEHSLSEEKEREKPILLKIAQRINPGYNPERHYKDIELLTLEKDVEFSDYIYPACLPFKEYEEKFDFSFNLTIAGWGTSESEGEGTDKPKEAVVPLVPLENCKTTIETTFNNALIDETQICLGGNGKDTCRGDSGGPAILYVESDIFRFFVIGITAYGIQPCGNLDFPGVYTYVPQYMKWILDNL